MLIDQYYLRSEESVSDAKGQASLQTGTEFVRGYNAQAHEIVDAITAAVLNAEAGSNRRIWTKFDARSAAPLTTAGERPKSSFDFDRS
jgi:hypothetical protein